MEVSYELLRTEAVSLADAQRYSLDVLVEGEPDVAALEEIAQRVAEEFRRTTDYQALNVGFYDYPEFVGHGYTLGWWRHAPWGEWRRAHEVVLGDYSQFVGDSGNLRRKDWTRRPDRRQVDLWKRWYEVVSQTDPSDAAEQRAFEQVGLEHGMDPQEVRTALTAVTLWVADAGGQG